MEEAEGVLKATTSTPSSWLKFSVLPGARWADDFDSDLNMEEWQDCIRKAAAADFSAPSQPGTVESKPSHPATACRKSSPQPPVAKPRWVDLSDSEDGSPAGASAVLSPVLSTSKDEAAEAHVVEVCTEDSMESAQLLQRPHVDAQRAESSALKGKGKGKGKSAGKGKQRHADQYSNRAGSSHTKGTEKGLSDKLQCQFTIGIEDTPAFPVVKNIIGKTGANMKLIVNASGAKLRLRGRGSGFLEGHEQQESTDDLMLCVSCQDHTGYEVAKRLVTELLEDIYKNYKTFCGKDVHVNINEGYRAGAR